MPFYQEKGSDYSGMRCTYLGQRLGRVFRKPCFWIGAEEGERLTLAELLPQMFEPHRSPGITVRPEKRHHLSKCTHAIPLGSCPLE